MAGAGPWDPTRFAHPWFARVEDLLARLADERDWPSIPTLNERFSPELQAIGVSLVEAEKSRPARGPDGTIDVASLYEVRIAERGEIPTRARNAHDLCNALVWAAFPNAKLSLSRALAQIQRARATGRGHLGSARTYNHDRLSLIDEGGLVCGAGEHASPAWIFGHAIYEHAYLGDFAIRGIAIDLILPDPDGLELPAARAGVDRALADAELTRVARKGPGIGVT